MFNNKNIICVILKYYRNLVCALKYISKFRFKYLVINQEVYLIAKLSISLVPKKIV